FVMQRPNIPLALTQTLNLTSHDARSLNLTLIGLTITPTPLATADLNLFNVRAQCDTCEFYFPRGALNVHTNSRIQGGIKQVDLSPNLNSLRAQAGVFISGNSQQNLVQAVRGGVLGGYLTFKTITARVSQGGTFVPLS